MADQQRPDDLAQLRARYDARFAAQDAEIARLKRRRRLPHRALPLALAILLAALVPLATLAANPFTDLNPGSPHNGNIDAIFNAGITTGCAPTEYCPSANVTREEMASFLARTAGLGGNPPIANALTAQTAQTATTATSAQTAVTAQTAASATNATNATNAGNANAVDGKSANELVRASRGSTANAFSAFTFTQQQTMTILAPAPGFVLVTAAVSPQTGAAAACPCSFHLRIAHAGVESPIQLQSIPTAGTTANLAATWVFPVAAGSQSFQLEIGKAPANAPVVYQNPTLTGLYVPFGYAGGPTLAP